jgi:hypothetical protein
VLDLEGRCGLAYADRLIIRGAHSQRRQTDGEQQSDGDVLTA